MENHASPGSYLAIQGFALVGINTQETLTILAGSINKAGMINGNLTIARFGRTLSFVQHSNKTHLLLADRGNNCIRTVDLASLLVDTHSGYCGRRDSGVIDSVEESFDKVRFKELYDMVVQPGTGIIVITDADSLRIIYDETNGERKVLTKYHARGLVRLRRIAFTNRKIYVTSSFDGVCIFDMSFEFETCFEPMVGYDQVSSTNMFATFNMPLPIIDTTNIYGVEKLSETNILVTMTSDVGTGLFTVNVNTHDATAICMGTTNYQFGLQSVSSSFGTDCTYNHGSNFLHLIDSTLLISGDTNGQGTLVEELVLNSR